MLYCHLYNVTFSFIICYIVIDTFTFFVDTYYITLSLILHYIVFDTFYITLSLTLHYIVVDTTLHCGLYYVTLPLILRYIVIDTTLLLCCFAN